jgi:hypothetical protein
MPLAILFVVQVAAAVTSYGAIRFMDRKVREKELINVMKMLEKNNGESKCTSVSRTKK